MNLLKLHGRRYRLRSCHCGGHLLRGRLRRLRGLLADWIDGHDYKARTIAIARGQNKPGPDETVERYKLVRLEPGPRRRLAPRVDCDGVKLDLDFDVTPGRGKPSSSDDPLPTYLGGTTLV